MQMGGRFPEAFVSILRMQNAAMSGREKSLATASVQGGLEFLDVAKQMRRLFGARGGVASQDLLLAAVAYLSLNSAKDNDAWVVYGKAKKQSGRRSKGESRARTGKDKVKGDGQTWNGFKPS